mgnify:CR=1 FL=1
MLQAEAIPQVNEDQLASTALEHDPASGADLRPMLLRGLSDFALSGRLNEDFAFSPPDAADCLVAVRYLVNPRRLIQGPTITAYEQAFARRIGLRYAYSFCSGRVGLYGLLRELGSTILAAIIHQQDLDIEPALQLS